MADLRVGLIESNDLVRAGRALVFNSQPDMKVVYEEPNGLVALSKVPDYLVDVLVVGHKIQGIESGSYISQLTKALRVAGNRAAVISMVPFIGDSLRWEVISQGAKEIFGLDQSAKELLSKVSKVVSPDYLFPTNELEKLNLSYGPLPRQLVLDSQISKLTDQQNKFVEMFLAGKTDNEICKFFDISKQRVSKTFDSLLESGNFVTRNQLFLYLQGMNS